MTVPPIQLWRLTLAVNDIDAMAAFYDDVFGCRFQPYSAYGTTLFRGELGGLTLVLCPNSLARIEAEQSRLQMHLAVHDVEGYADRAEEAGGRAEVFARNGGDLAAVISDPEGNTIELIRLPDSAR